MRERGRTRAAIRLNRNNDDRRCSRMKLNGSATVARLISPNSVIDLVCPHAPRHHDTDGRRGDMKMVVYTMWEQLSKLTVSYQINFPESLDATAKML